MGPTTVAPMQPWLTADGGRVRGEALAGDLAAILSLEDEAMPGRRAMVALCWHLRNATLVGNPAPIVARMWERLRSPVVGDMVVESTRGYYDAHHERGDWYRGVGILVAVRREWSTTDAEWTAETADDPDLMTEDNRSKDHAWYIQYGPAPDDVCRWGNCEFMMVPWRKDHLRAAWES